MPAPVFILCTARSGSTLLRFILDSHPELACPPEICPGRVCAALARMVDALHDQGGDVRDADPAAQLDLAPATAALLREVVGGQYGQYLKRVGKTRWCDKSLDNAFFAPLLAQVFPGAQFICLYRECMDVVASGLEASPWGLSSFGFTAHSAEFPGNNIAAIGHYWLTGTRAIKEFEAQNPDRCVRVRYEDLVSDPEETADSVFAFLEEKPVPGIAEVCLRTEHDAYGAADQKIWFTDRITPSSVGRGRRVPVDALPPAMRDQIDEVLGGLGYPPVGKEPAASAPAGSPRVPAESGAMAEIIAARLNGCSREKRGEVVRRWPVLAGVMLEIGIGESWPESAIVAWRFDHGAEHIWSDDSRDDPAEAGLSILASAGTWHALLNGEANMAIELVASRVHLDHHTERNLLREPAVFGLCTLLGISEIGAILVQAPSMEAAR